MAVDVSPALCWKNKRKKSLYAEEAGLGFIFRKVNKTEAVKDSSEPVANGVLQPLLINGDRIEPKSVFMNGHAQLFDEEATPLSQDSTSEANISFDASLLDGEELEEELHKEVELKRFLAQLKKDLSSGRGTSEEEVDRALSEVNKELKESGLYFKYMEADGPDELLPHPLTEQLREHIATLQASTERHTRELKEWDEVLERKRVELEHAKQNCESNKKINFSNLRPEDVAALKTYLTSDQLKLLNHSPSVDTTFVQEATTQLDAIHSKLDSEVKGARESCQQMTEWLKAFAPDGESMVDEETPRTLFRSLKRGLV